METDKVLTPVILSSIRAMNYRDTISSLRYRMMTHWFRSIEGGGSWGWGGNLPFLTERVTLSEHARAFRGERAS